MARRDDVSAGGSGAATAALPPPMLTAEPSAPAAPARRKVLLGLIRSSPYQNVVLAGHELSRFTQDVSYDPVTLGTVRTAMRGRVVELDDAWVERIKKRAREHVFRLIRNQRGDVIGAEILDTTKIVAGPDGQSVRPYLREPEDVPVSFYAYAVDPSTADRRYDSTSEPPTIDG